MTIKIVTDMGHLFRLAKAMGRAEQAFNANPIPGNAKAFQDAKAAHDDYHSICMKSDEINTGFTTSALAPR